MGTRKHTVPFNDTTAVKIKIYLYNKSATGIYTNYLRIIKATVALRTVELYL